MFIYKLKNKTVLHFGIGLIGSCIKNEFQNKIGNFNSNCKQFSIDWKKNHFQSSIISIFKHLETTNFDELIIIWSAGKIGFGATDIDANNELDIFKQFCELTDNFVSKKNISSKFILLSSAGGLHENQSNINNSSYCEPKRPYGFLKLNQEELVKSMNSINQKIILRPSSVFSTTYNSGRLGLINLIVINALKFKFTTFYGSLTTLRDYISSEDIAKFVVNKITANSNFELINYMVSAKPTSIFEIKNMVETKLNKQCYIKYLISKTNSSNITFHTNCLPIDFYPSNLKTNINNLVNNSIF